MAKAKYKLTKARRRHLRAMQAKNRRVKGCKNGYSRSRKKCRKAYRTPRQIAAARRNIAIARQAKAKKRRGRRGRR